MSGLMSEQDRDELAAGWPDYWKVHAAAEAIVARHVAAALTEAAEEIESRRDACANHGRGGFKGCGGDFCQTYMQGQTEAAALVRARIPT